MSEKINNIISEIKIVYEMDEEMEIILTNILTKYLSNENVKKKIIKKTDSNIKILAPQNNVVFCTRPVTELKKETVTNLKNLAKTYNISITTKDKKNDIISKLTGIELSKIEAIEVTASQSKKNTKTETIPSVISKYRQSTININKSIFARFVYPNTKYVIDQNNEIIGKENEKGEVEKLTEEDIEDIKSKNITLIINPEAIKENLLQETTINTSESLIGDKSVSIFQDEEELQEEE